MTGTQNKKIGAVVGLAAVAAAGYFIFGPNGKNNRKQIKGWTLKMKGDILERLEKLKDVTPETYNQIIDEVSAKYGKMKNITAGEIAAIVTDLRKHWKAIDRDIHASPQKRTSSKKSISKSRPKKKTSTKKESNSPAE